MNVWVSCLFFLLVFAAGPCHADKVAVLNLQKYQEADGSKGDTEMDGHTYIEKAIVNLSTSAVVLVDIWDSHPNEGWYKRSEASRKKCLKLLQFARDHKVKIIHFVSGRKIAKDFTPAEGEIVINTKDQTAGEKEFLRAIEGKDTLFYGGYALNYCVLFSPAGIYKAWDHGKNVILVRDCTTAIETPETLKDQWGYRVGINLVEAQLGSTIVLDDLLKASIANYPLFPSPNDQAPKK